MWMLKALWGGPGEMAQLFRELDLGSIPSTHDRRLKLPLLVSMGNVGRRHTLRLKILVATAGH